jgi:hypothetical protein
VANGEAEGLSFAASVYVRTAFLDRPGLTWQLGPHDDLDAEPTSWVAATVPGGA